MSVAPRWLWLRQALGLTLGLVTLTAQANVLSDPYYTEDQQAKMAKYVKQLTGVNYRKADHEQALMVFELSRAKWNAEVSFTGVGEDSDDALTKSFTSYYRRLSPNFTTLDKVVGKTSRLIYDAFTHVTQDPELNAGWNRFVAARDQHIYGMDLIYQAQANRVATEMIHTFLANLKGANPQEKESMHEALDQIKESCFADKRPSFVNCFYAPIVHLEVRFAHQLLNEHYQMTQAAQDELKELIEEADDAWFFGKDEAVEIANSLNTLATYRRDWERFYVPVSNEISADLDLLVHTMRSERLIIDQASAEVKQLVKYLKVDKNPDGSVKVELHID